MRKAVLVIGIVLVTLFGYDYFRLRQMLADYQDVRDQAICAHNQWLESGQHK